MRYLRHLQILFLLLVGIALAACSATSSTTSSTTTSSTSSTTTSTTTLPPVPSDLDVAEEFSAAFVEGDVDALESLSTDLAILDTIPWRSQFLAALDLEAESSNCLELETEITCTIVGHNARTKLLYPDYTVKRSLHLTIEDGVVTRGSFEFASPEIPVDVFNLWAVANRPDVLEGPCADIDGTSDPAVCAAAVLEVAVEYLAATGG